MKKIILYLCVGLISFLVAGIFDLVQEQNIEIVSGTVTSKWLRTGLIGNSTEYEWVEIDNVSYKTHEWYVDGILFDRGQNVWLDYDIGAHVENLSMKRGFNSPNKSMEAMPVFMASFHGFIMVYLGTDEIIEKFRKRGGKAK